MTAPMRDRSVPSGPVRGPSDPSPYPTVLHAIVEHARTDPDTPAIVQGAVTLSRGQSVSGAVLLAHRLRDAGVRPGDTVGLSMRRTPDLVTAWLGVALCGAVVVPVDRHAGTRWLTVLRDADVRVLVCDEDLGDTAPATTLLVHHPSSELMVGSAGATGDHSDRARTPSPDGTVREAADLLAAIDPTRPAYVLYTSGSTGTPKGVVVGHPGVSDFCWAFGRATGVGPGTVAYAGAAVTFDVFVLDVLVPLVHGGCVAFADEDTRQDPDLLHAFAARHGVTWGFLPVSLLPLLSPERLPGWTTLITGAEAPGPEQVHRWGGGVTRTFANCYGPTEATVVVSTFEASGVWDSPLPLGGPLPNHALDVCAEDGSRCAVGERGELWVAGSGLARGYLNRPQESATVFVERDGERWYRTGDVCTRTTDDTFLIHGRLDRQVKVRGQRVELGEVEAVMGAHPQTSQASATLRRRPDGDVLVGYVTGPVTVDGLRDWLRARLPDAMIPARLVVVDRLPTTASGKVDTAALEARHGDATADLPGADTGTDHPVGEDLAGQVRRAWALVLDVPDPAGSDTFYGSGGHSVAAMRLVAEVRERTGIRVGVAALARAADLDALVDLVVGAQAQGHERSGAALPTGSPPALPPSGRRLWFSSVLLPDSPADNIPLAYRLSGPLDVSALEEALARVEVEQDALRLRVDPQDGGCSLAEPAPRVPIDRRRAGDDDLERLMAADALVPIPLGRGRLWRAVLWEVSGVAGVEHLLCLTFHHLVFDGWSVRPFTQALSRAHAVTSQGTAVPTPHLGPPGPRHADYVAWRQARDAERGDRDLTWWAQHLATAPTVITLPEPPGGRRQGHTVGQHVAALDAALVEQVTRTAAAFDVPAAALYLAAFAETLRRLTGAEDLIIGLPVADRDHPDVAPLVGLFVDILPLRLRPVPESPFGAAARDAAAELRTTAQHPGAPLEDIARAVGAQRRPGRNTLVQVQFNRYNFDLGEPLHLAGITSRPVEPGSPGTSFDLTAYLDADPSGAPRIRMVFDPSSVDSDAVERAAGAFVEILRGGAARPATTCADLAPGRGYTHASTRDRAAAPDRPSAPTRHRSDRVEPREGTERRVAQVWSEVLSIPLPGATDNFFDVGGHSLAIARVRATLVSTAGVDVSMVDLFGHPTVRDLAAHLDRASADSAADPATTDRTGMTSAARRADARREAAQRRTRSRRAPGRSRRSQS